MADMNGDTWLEHVHQDDIQDCRNGYDSAFSSRTAVSMRYRMRRFDGVLRLFYEQGFPWYDDFGVFLGFAGSCRDITDEEMLGANLRAEEELRRLCFDECPWPMWTCEPQTRKFLSANTAALAIFGCGRDELLTATESDYLLNPQVTGQEAGSGMELRVVLSGGDARLVEIVSRTSELNGSPVEFVAAREYRESDAGCCHLMFQHSRTLFDSVNSVVLQWGVDGRISYVNALAEAFFGWSAEEAVGLNVGIFVPDRDSLGTDLSALVSDIAANPEKYRNQVNENVCRDGRRVWLAWTNTALRDRDGRVQSVLAIGNDVTELRQRQVELQRANEDLRAISLVTVDREERMVELKREVNALAAELGRPEPYPLDFMDDAGQPAQRPE